MSPPRLTTLPVLLLFGLLAGCSGAAPGATVTPRPSVSPVPATATPPVLDTPGVSPAPLPFSPDAAGTPPPTTSGITDAVATRDALLRAAPPGTPIAGGDVAIAAWPGRVAADVLFVGAGLVAGPHAISGHGFFPDRAGTPILPVAVVDVRGRCAGALLESTDGGRTVTGARAVSAPSPCTGLAVEQAAGR